MLKDIYKTINLFRPEAQQKSQVSHNPIIYRLTRQ